jgi:ATP-binding cassette subfamily F protein 3
LIDALASQIWEVDPDDSQMTIFKGTYSQMKEERKKEEERATERLAASATVEVPNGKRAALNARSKEERRKLAQVQELENVIAALEKQLADLGAQLENPPADAYEVTKLGKEYERVQREMDVKLSDWERAQG